MFAPAVARLRERGRSRNAAALIVWTVAVLTLVLVVVVLALAFVPYLVDLVHVMRNGIGELHASLDEMRIPPIVGAVVNNVFESMRASLASSAGSLVSSIASAATIVVLAVFLVFFLLRDGDKAWMWIFQAAGEEKRETITNAGRDALGRAAGYLRGTTVLAAIIAVTNYVFMLTLDVPLALALAVFSFLAGFVPYLGGLITTLVLLLVTLGVHGPWSAFVMLCLIAIRNVIIAYGVRPSLDGRTVSIHPAVVLLALPAGYELGGIVGLFVAVPVTAFFLAITRAAVQILQPDMPLRTPALVPAWLDRVAQVSWRLLVVVGLASLAISLVVIVPLVVVPIMAGLILAATVDPLSRGLMRRGRSRTSAAALAVGGSSLVVALMLVAAALALVPEAQEVGSAAVAGATSVDSAAGGNVAALVNIADFTARGLVTVASQFFGAIATFAFIVVLSGLLAFYFLRDGEELWARVAARAQASVADRLGRAGRRAYEVLGGYMLGTAAISFVGAASQWLIMVVLGVPLALPVFVLSFFLEFIPYIGGYISTGIALLLTIAVGTPFAIVVMIIWTLVFNLVAGNIVAPIVYSRTVHIHPAIVLLAVPAGAAVAGIAGMFMAVPVIGIVSATWRTVVAVLGHETEEDAAAAETQEPPPDLAPPSTIIAADLPLSP